MVLRVFVVAGMLTVAMPLCANLIQPPAGNVCDVVQTTLQRERAFASVTAAVSAMAREHLAASVRADREYVGGVLQDADGRYWTTVGIGCAGRDRVTFAVGVPVGLRLSAFWHTHGAAGPMRNWFSPDDVELVATTGYDFYLITPSGALRVLSHTNREVQRSMPGTARVMPRATVGRAVAPDHSDERVTTRAAADAAPV
jgi:hypothetical protein